MVDFLHADKLFSLEGKSILITGATGHLGRSMSIALAQAGARVFVNSRSHSRAEQIVSELRAAGHSAEAAAFDISCVGQISAFFSAWSEEPLHGLVNNAYSGASGTIETSEANEYHDSYHMSVVAAHEMVRAALPALRRAVSTSGDASVLNVASMYGMVSPDRRLYKSPQAANPPFYGAAKAGLIQWTRYAACEFGREGIRFNSISPGPFPSVSVQQDDPCFVNSLASKVPLGRIGRADEIGGAVIFLLSRAASYVNGVNLTVDGGWTSW